MQGDASYLGIRRLGDYPLDDIRSFLSFLFHCSVRRFFLFLFFFILGKKLLVAHIRRGIFLSLSNKSRLIKLFFVN